MKTYKLNLLPIAVPVMVFLAGCGCLSTQRVRAKMEELRLQNRMRAEPAMLATAKSQGAVLLSVPPQDISFRLPCLSGTDETELGGGEPPQDACVWIQSKSSGCQEWASDGRSFLIRDKGKKPILAVPVQQVEGSAYARLAQRGNKFFILMPRLTIQDEVGTVTECECDGMPRVQCPSSFGFILSDAPSSPEIEVVWVPMAEKHYRTICKAVAV